MHAATLTSFLVCSKQSVAVVHILSAHAFVFFVPAAHTSRIDLQGELVGRYDQQEDHEAVSRCVGEGENPGCRHMATHHSSSIAGDAMSWIPEFCLFGAVCCTRVNVTKLADSVTGSTVAMGGAEDVKREMMRCCDR